MGDPEMGWENNTSVLLILCFILSLLLAMPLIWICFLNLTYRLRMFQNTRHLEKRLIVVEHGLEQNIKEMQKVIRKVTWLEGVLAVQEGEGTNQVDPPPSYLVSQIQTETEILEGREEWV